MIPIEYWLVFSSLLFVIGAYGVLTRRNAIVVLMS
ncbi:MAG: NADH-quinone oxidoreductase subunit NuoK, partial [Candidatus Thermoplasmatota archaeon]|nr:NADH-quinone oxidoreductase subunit NuoK [Candidatus Thermoplasmatota archaeon]